MIIDLYTHMFPHEFFKQLVGCSKGLGNLAERMKSVKAVTDLDQRFREMDGYGDYRQIITVPHPVLEEVATPSEATRLAGVANDGMAELCRKHPDRFPAFVATVSLTDVEAAVSEVDRAVTQLGAKGIQIYSNIAGRPLDDPEFEPIFAVMAKHRLPMWLHPARTAGMADYSTEAKSRYELWWCLGWPYETSVAMCRLVFSGIFDRYPNLKIITHHLGGMIPYFDGRIGPGMEVLGTRTADEDYSAVLKSLKKPHLDYFKMFYADTAMFGGTSGLPSGMSFFGTDHVVFATDAPFGPIGPTLRALEQLDLSLEDRRKILSGNAQELLGMTFN
ncbi:MAG: amidohydrolase family protein [Deferrisomatales bacterium]|nr:amidohydrolase family protein [Deferrisomatales bacterium]